MFASFPRQVLQRDGDILHALLRRTAPAVHRHLSKHEGVKVYSVCRGTRGPITGTLPWDSLLRVWDCFLCEGVTVYSVCVVGPGVPSPDPALGQSAERVGQLPVRGHQGIQCVCRGTWGSITGTLPWDSLLRVWGCYLCEGVTVYSVCVEGPGVPSPGPCPGTVCCACGAASCARASKYTVCVEGPTVPSPGPCPGTVSCIQPPSSKKQTDSSPSLFQVLFKAALVILAGALGPAKVRKRASGLCETLEVLRHPPEGVLGEEYLMYHMQRLNLTEEDSEFEHQRQTACRRAMPNRRSVYHTTPHYYGTLHSIL
ncbi:hypothetical protein evm_015429 [Chilo suppressalis]|nr:hypothetical protein evm_015429 [Chilo suppressalis]